MKEFLDMYQNLNKDNLHLLEPFYTVNVQFIDPVHEIQGLEQLTAYFAALYQNVESINFSFHNALEGIGECYVQWDMTFIHSKLAGGRPITCAGATFLRSDDNGRVFHHRDCFDLGAMVYEQIPLLGRAINSIKRRLGK